jgi:hypothetical protein
MWSVRTIQFNSTLTGEALRKLLDRMAPGLKKARPRFGKETRRAQSRNRSPFGRPANQKGLDSIRKDQPPLPDHSSGDTQDKKKEGRVVSARVRDATLSQLRALIGKADPAVVEVEKWKKPTNPKAVSIWSHDGIICTGGTLKDAGRLTFPKGCSDRGPKETLQLESKGQCALPSTSMKATP